MQVGLVTEELALRICGQPYLPSILVNNVPVVEAINY